MGKDKKKHNQNGSTPSFEERCKKIYRSTLRECNAKYSTDTRVKIALELDDICINQRVKAQTESLKDVLAKVSSPDMTTSDYEYEWAYINLLTFPHPIDVGNSRFNYLLAAALWILDELRNNGSLETAISELDVSKEQLESISIPNIVSQYYTVDVIKAVVYVLRYRNIDCIGTCEEGHSPEDSAFRDSFTINGTQRQDVPSRKRYEQLLSHISKEHIDLAVANFKKNAKKSVLRYMQAISIIRQEEKMYTRLIKEAQEEIRAQQKGGKAIIKNLSGFGVQNLPLRMKTDVPGISFQDDVILQLQSSKVSTLQGKQKIEEYMRKRTESVKEQTTFATASISRMDWPDNEWDNHYSSEIATIMKGFSATNPYEVFFALLYIVDSGSILSWISYPVSCVITAAIVKLPWLLSVDQYGTLSEKFFVKDDSTQTKLGWYDLLIERTNEEGQPVCISPATYIFEKTNVIVPFDTPSVNLKNGINKQSLSEWCSFYTDAVSGFGAQVDLHEPETNSEEPELPQEVIEEIQALKKELRLYKEQLHQAEKALNDEKKSASQRESEYENAKNELSDLRELVFTFNQGEEPDLDESSIDNIDSRIPYETIRNTIIIGGHPTWLKGIKPMLPNVKFIDNVQSALQIKNADVIWLQTNAMNHSNFYKVVDIAKTNGIPIRYFTSSSATKCVAQLISEDTE